MLVGRLAILRLSDRLEFSDAVKPIKLPDFGDGFVAAGTLCTLSGWGDTDDPNDSDEPLRRVELPIVDQRTCVRVYMDGIESLVGPGEICTGDMENGGKDGSSATG